MSILVVYIVDLSGAVDGLVKPFIRRMLKMPKNAAISINPFDCSLCMTFWTGLIYLACIGKFTFLNMLIVCALSFFSSSIAGLIRNLKELVDALFDFIFSKVIRIFE